MSHDELLPEPDALPTAEEATEAALETSSEDAPPAAPRRRSVRAAGAAAASAPEPAPTEKPAPRRRKAKTTEAAPPEAAPAAPLAASVPAETPEPAASEKPTRRRVAKKKTDAPEIAVDAAAEIAAPESVAAIPEAAAPDAAASEEAAPEKPTRRRALRRAKNAEGEPVAAAPESVPAAQDEAAGNETEATLTAADVAVEVTPLPSVEITPLPDASEAVAAEETAAIEDGSRRRRRPRRRADLPEKPAETVADTSQALADTPAAETNEATETTETASESDSDADDAPGSLRSRRRRSGRTRRDREKDKEKERIESAPPLVAVSPMLPGIVAVAPLPPVIEREPPIDTRVGAHLLKRNGLPEITINTVVYPPVLFFGNMEEEASRPKVVAEARRAAANGVHLHSVLVELPCPLSESNDALDRFDNRVRALLDADPDGFVMPRIVFIPARGWKREYPNEIASYADGTSSDPSLTSERFWAEAERSLITLIGHVREHEWGKRVFGYHLERGEWFQPQDSGYDRSAANRDAFRDWLREKYKHDLVGLRAAWYDADVQFHTAEIPPLPTKPNSQKAFFETRRERRYIDFNEFTSESTAQRLVSLAKTAKQAAKHQALVSVAYGYTFEFGHGYSGHLALETLLDSPHIDLLCGPPSYRDRSPGGAASLPAPVESVLLHGKLWISEDDTKTHLAPAAQDPDDYNPRLPDRFATEQAQIRAMGQALTRNIGIGWMDLWGEGWLDEDAIWERIGAFTANLATARSLQDGLRVPEVVALIDEKSLLHLQRGEPFFRKITNGLRETLQKTGVSFGTYLQSDLLRDDFPLTAKLYLFLTPYRLTPAIRAAIQEKLQSGGKTLAFLFAPGSCETRPALSGAMEEAAGGSVGLILRQQEWNSEIGSRVIEPHHPLTERLSGREIGTRERINPSFFVDDPDAATLAEYQGSGLPSIAVRDFGKWKSVFVGEPILPLEMLRGICRYAGVNVWQMGEDVFSAGNGWVFLHGAKDGQRTLRLPAATGLYDMTEGRLLSENSRDYRFFLKGGTTRLFYVGDPKAMRDLGLPNLPASGAGRPARSWERPGRESGADNAADQNNGRDADRETDRETETAPPENLLDPFFAKREAARETERETGRETENGADSDTRNRSETEDATKTTPTPLFPLFPVRTSEREIEAPPSLRADLATLEAVLSLDVSELDLEIEEAGVETPTPRPVLTGGGILPLSIFGEESEADAKRRRRRGGRGRGRRRFGSISEEKTDGDASDSPAPQPGDAPYDGDE